MVLYAVLLFFAVRWAYPVAALCVLGFLAVSWLAVFARLWRTAGRADLLWFRWERLVEARLVQFLLCATLPFVAVEISDGDRPDWDSRFALVGVFVAGIAMQSGQSWKDEDRVRSLLGEGERLKVAVPVRWSRASLWRRSVRGRFLVFTDRRVVLFAYRRFLDVPDARPLWSAPAGSCTANVRVAERELVLEGAGAATDERVFKVAAVRKEDLKRYAAGAART
ncbi:hypothetical protein [Streptomyces cremeus]|uniref:PH domain-containing protein n=1 Tax=Streptomyces cremeus TaxID=66881 RepID=A0ABV5PFR2_STRCM